MLADPELLRRYSEDKSQEAFAELVRRHLDFVYAVALRQVGGDAHLAQDVSQAVFTALARKAGSLAARPVLGGWLYRTTQFTAIDAVRGEQRRRAREQEAQLMHELTRSDETAADAEKLRPLLDRAIGELGDDDRDAVVLRFFSGCTFPEIAARLRLTESGARMRVERALDKLHVGLARRGVTSTSAALAVALANQPAVAAPAGLAAAITGAALAGSGAGLAGVMGLKFLGFMTPTKIVTGVATVVALATVGSAVYEAGAGRENRATPVAPVPPAAIALATKVDELEARLAAETKRAQAAEEDTGRLLQVVEGLRTPPAAEAPGAEQPVTHDMVEERYKRAQALARNGNAEAALQDFLWCFDEGMRRVTSYTGVRLSFLLGEIVRLGEQYPAALAALRERRDRAAQRVVASATDSEAAMEFSALNRTLKDEAATLALYDQLPRDDQRRRTFANAAYQQFVASQRYADALVGRPYPTMSSLFELNQQERPLPPNTPDPARLRKAQHDSFVNSTATNIEVLAGGGDLEHARALAQRLFAVDSSDETKTIVQQHLTRAGHPELLNAPPKF
jgi:RNA polymerase sigma factor (sigma-70 family)